MQGRSLQAMNRFMAAAVFALTTQGALAQVDSGLPSLPAPPKPQLPTPDAFADGQMKALDANGDKKITWTEFSGRLRKAFDDMDIRRRGYLTRAELKAAYEKAIAQMPRLPTEQ